MRLTIDTEQKTLSFEDNSLERKTLNLYSKEAFELISKQWLSVGFTQNYCYKFTWMGRPIIQLPQDMIRIQEAIYHIKPDVILECGVAHGGSLIFYASLCKVIGKGKVIGVDVEIRSHNRKALETHELFPFITLVEGSSIDPKTICNIKSLIKPNQTVLVILDSKHTKDHVLAELEAYHDLVSIGSYIIAADGIIEDLHKHWHGKSDWNEGKQKLSSLEFVKDWDWNNPKQAAIEFASQHPNFIIEQPEWPFNESRLSEDITYWPSAWLKKIK